MSDFKAVLDKLDKLDARIDNIDITLVKQQISLDYHIKRSDQADAAIKLLSEKLEPVETHVDRVNFAIKIAAYTGAVLTFFAGLYATFR